MDSFIAALLNSLDVGMLLFVIASGLTIIFGVLGVLNFAHGALYMLGAYMVLTFMQYVALPFWVSVIIAPLVVALLAAIIERLAIRQVYRRHITQSLLLTFALLLILDNGVRMIWGTSYYVVDPPAPFNG